MNNKTRGGGGIARTQGVEEFSPSCRCPPCFISVCFPFPGSSFPFISLLFFFLQSSCLSNLISRPPALPLPALWLATLSCFCLPPPALHLQHCPHNLSLPLSSTFLGYYSNPKCYPKGYVGMREKDMCMHRQCCGGELAHTHTLLIFPPANLVFSQVCRNSHYISPMWINLRHALPKIKWGQTFCLPLQAHRNPFSLSWCSKLQVFKKKQSSNWRNIDIIYNSCFQQTCTAEECPIKSPVRSKE